MPVTNATTVTNPDSGPTTFLSQANPAAAGNSAQEHIQAWKGIFSCFPGYSDTVEGKAPSQTVNVPEKRHGPPDY